MPEDIFNDEAEVKAARKVFGEDIVEDFEMYEKFKIWLDPDKEFVNLTDMWRAIDGKASQTPYRWRKLPSYKRFEEGFLTKTNSSTDGRFSPVGKYIKVIKGGGEKGKKGVGSKTQGTYAHWQIAIEYARYLDKKFATWANRVLRERFEEIKHPDVGKKRASRRYAITKIKNQYDRGEITFDEMLELVKVRDDGINTWNNLKHSFISTGIVKGEWPIKKMLSKIEKVLTGKTVMEQKKERGLKGNENYRNHLSSRELSERATIETIAAIIIETCDRDISYGQLSHALDKVLIVIASILKKDRRCINDISNLGDRLLIIEKHPRARTFNDEYDKKHGFID